MKKRSLKPYLVRYKYNGESNLTVVLACSECAAVQRLIHYYVAEVVRSPDCLTEFSTQLIPHIR